MEPRPVRRHYWKTANLPHMVYELYDKDGEPLYVGQTGNLADRLATHARQPWWRDVAQVCANLHPDRAAARQAEGELIDRLQPAWNIQGAEIGREIQRDGHRRRKAASAEA